MFKTTDQLQRTLQLSRRPEKIISVVPSQTELLFDLGLNEEVIGITKFCIHPDEWFRSKTRIGGTKNLDIEKIRALSPDLIIANKEENEEEQIRLLTDEFPVWISDIQNLGNALEMIHEISVITGKEKNGKAIIEKIVSEFDTLYENRFRKLSCAYLIWKNPWMTVGGDTFVSQMLQHAGFWNVFEHRNRYPEITIKDLVTLRPEVILLSSEPFPFKLEDIKEMQENVPLSKVHFVDGEMFSWYGSRMIKSPSYFSDFRGKIQSAL